MTVPGFIIEEVRVCCPRCTRKFAIDISHDEKEEKRQTQNNISNRRRNGSVPLYAPSGVTITEEDFGWIITSNEYKEHCHYRYRGVKMTKARWHDSDKAMAAFLRKYGTKKQREEYAASGCQLNVEYKLQQRIHKPAIYGVQDLTKEQRDEIANIVSEVIGESGIEGASFGEDDDNSFAFYVSIPGVNDKPLVIHICNKLFHRLGLLPQDKDLMIGQLGDYCNIVSTDGYEEDGECYVAAFNHPVVKGFRENNPEARFILKNWREWDREESD